MRGWWNGLTQVEKGFTASAALLAAMGTYVTAAWYLIVRRHR